MLIFVEIWKTATEHLISGFKDHAFAIGALFACFGMLIILGTIFMANQRYYALKDSKNSFLYYKSVRTKNSAFFSFSCKIFSVGHLKEKFIFGNKTIENISAFMFL